MEEKNYRVLRIEEQLYGCEELPEGQPVLCDVLLEAADGTQRVLPYPDAELTRLDINEGSTVTLRDHRLAKAAHKVYFTRHGETVWNVENKICGMTDSPLTEKGRAQARELGEKLRTSGLRIDEIHHNISFIFHIAKILVIRQNGKQNSGAVKRRNRNKVKHVKCR